MSFEELGNLGEFIGSVLVLITLFILVFQLRQAQKTISSSSYLDSARLFFELFDEAAGSEFLSGALAKSRKGVPLDPAEEAACEFYFRSMFRRAEALYNLKQQNLISPERLEQVGERIGNSASNWPLIKEVWSTDAASFDAGFRAWFGRYVNS